MSRITIVLTTMIALTAASAHLSGSIGQQKLYASQTRQKSTKPPYVRAKFFFSSEMVYEDIRIVDSKLIVRYLPEKARRKVVSEHSNYMPQCPWYSQDDLKTVETELTATQLQDFVALVKDSGFFKIKSPVGPNGERYYPYRIFVDLDGRPKTVEYRSTYRPPKMPEGFRRVKDWLRHAAETNCPGFDFRL